MSQSMTIHDVTGITIKRSKDPENHWTTLVVEHNNWGYNDKDEYATIKTTTEIICHHNDRQKLLVKIQNKMAGS